MSWGDCGDLKRKFCMMVVRKRKSSILARPSPKQYRFPEGMGGGMEVRLVFIATLTPLPTDPRLYSPREDGLKSRGLRDFQRSCYSSLSLFP